jgi:hypothetical protein
VLEPITRDALTLMTGLFWDLADFAHLMGAVIRIKKPA